MIRSAFRSLPAILGAFVIASCSDAGVSNLTAPADPVGSRSSDSQLSQQAPGSSSKDKHGLQLRALWWDKKHNKQVRVSKTIGELGGTISIPETGLTMVFPAGAVASSLQITITADEDYVAYKMDPAGTTFLQDVVVTQSLSTTELKGHTLRSELFAAYIADDRLKLSGKVPVLEIEPSHTIFSTILPRVPIAHVWTIRHFSRYMLASG
jgi:hypothetical protein